MLKLGIALSGGGIRGIAHAGVLKALEENDIKIDAISGTSSGGLVASLYAMGYSPYHIYILCKKYSKKFVGMNSKPLLSGISNLIKNRKITLSGLRTGKSIEDAYNQIALRKNIVKIKDVKKMPLVIPAVDVQNSKECVFTNKIPRKTDSSVEYITDISIGKAVRASISFPGVFCPCEFENHKFLDGGILDNIPVLELKKQGTDKVIAVNFKADDINSCSNIMDIGMRTIDIMGNKISEESLNSSDFILTVATDKTGLLDTEKVDNCYEYGYKAAMQNINKIREILIK